MPKACSGTQKRHDWLVLVLLWHEVRNGLRALSGLDRAFFIIAGSVLLASQAEDAFVALRVRAAGIASAAWLWHLVLPATAFGTGLGAGALGARLARLRAYAPFLAVLPLSAAARRRMADRAALSLGLVVALGTGLALGLVCFIVHKPGSALWGSGGAALCGLGVVADVLARRRVAPAEGLVLTAEQHSRTFQLPFLAWLDGARPAWLGSWACGLPAGLMRVTLSLVLSLTVLGAVAVLAGGASLAQRDAAPAVVAGLAGGLAVFMLSLRCHPLGSAVLGAAPLGFLRGWLGVLRLPLAFSVMFFAMPAGVAVAAAPHEWAMPLGGGFSLLLLDGVYAVFAAYFMMTPLLAALSFAAVLTYAAVKSLEYHDVAYFCLAAFLVLLWQRTRRRFLHG